MRCKQRTRDSCRFYVKVQCTAHPTDYTKLMFSRVEAKTPSIPCFSASVVRGIWSFSSAWTGLRFGEASVDVRDKVSCPGKLHSAEASVPQLKRGQREYLFEVAALVLARRQPPFQSARIEVPTVGRTSVQQNITHPAPQFLP